MCVLDVRKSEFIQKKYSKRHGRSADPTKKSRIEIAKHAVHRHFQQQNHKNSRLIFAYPLCLLSCSIHLLFIHLERRSKLRVGGQWRLEHAFQNARSSHSQAWKTPLCRTGWVRWVRSSHTSLSINGLELPHSSLSVYCS